MKNTLKRLLAVVLVMCSILSYTVPAANGTSSDTTTTDVVYNFNVVSDYNAIPKAGNNENPFTYEHDYAVQEVLSEIVGGVKFYGKNID